MKCFLETETPTGNAEILIIIFVATIVLCYKYCVVIHILRRNTWIDWQYFVAIHDFLVFVM